MHGEYVRSVLLNIESTPMDITVSLSQRVFDQTPQKIIILKHLTRHDHKVEKTISLHCPFKGTVRPD
jgi:hypothetical protein